MTNPLHPMTNPQQCPHIRTSDEGTSYCELAERTAAVQQASDGHDQEGAIAQILLAHASDGLPPAMGGGARPSATNRVLHESQFGAVARAILARLSFGMDRCHRLQAENHRFREPERTILCDILANGTLLPDPNGTRYGRPAVEETGESVVIPDELHQIGHRLRTQDNRCTANPIFQVQVKERIYGFDSAYSDGFEWKDDDHNSVEIPEGADPDSPPNGVTVVHYTTVWRVVMAAFTEEACKEHLRLNGHNYRGEVRIYADSLYRCPEMIAIRGFLMKLSLPQAKEQQLSTPAPAVAPVARPIDEWHEDIGAVTWWRFPVEEPPYCGSPLDTEWVPGYYTHFTPIVVPQPPQCGEVAK
jgi:hypothetical protein